jgi:archaellin
MSVNSVFALVAILTAGVMRIVLQRANRQIEQGKKSVAQAMKGEARADIAGLTEAENRERMESFRYIT